MRIRRYAMLVVTLLAAVSGIRAQEFFNLTASEVHIDSLLPHFTHQFNLGPNYRDSVYEVRILYPEFIDMSGTDVERLKALGSTVLPEMPEISTYVSANRKQGRLSVAFVPLVMRNGKYQKLVSFKLQLTAHASAKARSNRSSETSVAYADHSVLASGQWAKIRVGTTGIYQLSDAFLKKIGFSQPAKVKIYGYGGALQPEKLTPEYLSATDDLPEVPTCTIGGKRLFHAVGPVNWKTAANAVRDRNFYSQYGYYFLTESDEDPLTVDSTTFVNSFYPSANYYHSLYETDDYAWFHGGRKLYDKQLFGVGTAHSYTLPAHTKGGKITIAASYDAPFTAEVMVNDSVVGQLRAVSKPNAYSVAAENRWTFNLTKGLKEQNNIVIKQTDGDNLRLDYIVLTANAPRPLGNLSQMTFQEPEYVYHITNQDLHAHTAIDMLIIIPTTQKFRDQAERLKLLHEEKDGLRVRILPADELYNEFSSGTPDGNAYRRYLKMLYDRAETDDDLPRYLLLFGDGAWDNRMLCADWTGVSPDDFLLCYESDNSFSETECFVTDDYFCLLDDNEGGDILKEMGDVAVGRLAARTAEEAKIYVDKIISYRNNEQAGAWQNTICFMADDGNENRHMIDAEATINVVKCYNPNFNIKKIYWDAYTRVASSTGYSYPDVTRLIKQQMQDGALVMNYTGHGAPYTISHEMVLFRSDFEAPTSLRLPLWITASCDIMPFDGQTECIGEAAMMNKNGGAIAFFGTARTVFANSNQLMNRAFMRHVLEIDEDGHRVTVGEAARRAKNDLVSTGAPSGTSTAVELDGTTNKMQFVLLGDPALALAVPTLDAVIDSINGKSVAEGVQTLPAGSQVTVKGHIVDHPEFSGRVTLTIRDVEQTIQCKLNEPVKDEDPYLFNDRMSTIFNGSDSIADGKFTVTFAVPLDISYSTDTGQMLVYAVNNDHSLSAHGEENGFIMGSNNELVNDGQGPNIYCYLNSTAFSNGDRVNTTPYFFAELSDKDGINAAGSSIGHDLELIIDGEMRRTYNLNSYYQYDFGDYTRGTVGFSIPALTDGTHKLLFRAWDILNNSSTAELSFVVDSSLQPSGISVICINNPASSATRFIINHDRIGSEMDVVLEIFDPSGRKLWERAESGVPTDQTYVVDWDQTVSGGRRLPTGVYLYRVLVSCNGSQQATAAKKLIVLGNK